MSKKWNSRGKRNRIKKRIAKLLGKTEDEEAHNTEPIIEPPAAPTPVVKTKQSKKREKTEDQLIEDDIKAKVK